MVSDKESCVNISHCLPCDNEGHSEGDVWKIGNCTTCQCKDSVRTCKTIECPENELKCGLHGVVTALPLIDGECCQKYTCNYSTPNCSEMSSKPKCADDQELKIIVNDDGCNTFVCQCLPCNTSEFDAASNTSNGNSLLPGYEQKVDTSGCCSKVVLFCNVSTCPKPYECEDNYNLLELPPLANSCCPQYACEPRKDGCFYKMLHKNSGKGGEANRSQEEEHSVFKMPSEEWNDGPCHTCRCEGRGPYQAICPAKQCTSIIDDDYVVEEKTIYGECCPEYVRTECKDNGKIYKIGDSWKPADGNPCALYSCQDGLDGVKKTMIKEQCNTQCDTGYQYYPSTSEDKCCGECKEQGCIFEGKLYPETTTWHSDDKCTQYFCLQINGTFQIDAATITCPNQGVDNMNEFAVEYDIIDGECCKKPKFIGCLVENKLIQFGDNYTSLDTNPCETVLCTFNKTSGKPSRSVKIKECAQCSLGWEYVPPLESSSECCGTCEQRFCIHNGTHYNEGDTWASADGCINFSCTNINKQLQVIMKEPNCPKNLECPKDLIVDDGCCKKCEYKCMAHTREKSTTIKLIQEQNEHGICQNLEEIPQFLECKGSCPSSYLYKKGKSSYVNECNCCKEKGHKTVTVELICEDNFSYKTSIKIPASCSCDICSASFTNEYDPNEENNGLNIRGNTE